MWTKIFDFLIVAVATASSAYVKEIIFKADVTLAYSFSALTGLCIFFFLHLSALFARRVLKLDKRYRYVGNWMETMQKDGAQHWSMFSITHSIISNEFKITGNTFDVITGEHHADWWSVAVAFLHDSRLYYLHQGSVTEKSGEISGVTRMAFTGSGRHYDDGVGYIIDNDQPLRRLDFVFHRLSKAMVKSLIGKKRIVSRDDRTRFITAWKAQNQPKVEVKAP